jgi:hypothetical protein
MTARIAAVALVGMTLALAGCRGPEEGTTYAGGLFSGVLPASLPIAVEATVDTLEELQMTINRREVNAGASEGRVIGRSDMDVRCDVELYDAGEGSTRVRIRVGLSGDREYSYAIYRRIRSKLGHGG